MRLSLHYDSAGLLMHVWNRDAFKARIKVITTEAESNLNSVKLRLEQVQSQITTEQQNFKVKLDEAQRVTKQITIERDELLSRIDLLTNVNGK